MTDTTVNHIRAFFFKIHLEVSEKLHKFAAEIKKKNNYGSNSFQSCSGLFAAYV